MPWRKGVNDKLCPAALRNKPLPHLQTTNKQTTSNKMESSLFAKEIGDGIPLLVIHGWEMEGGVEEIDFEPIFSKIAGIRRIYVDLPGMGQTPANGIKSQDDIYERLVEFINIKIEKTRFLVAGTSCGGYLARAIVQKYSDQVDGLLLRVPLIEPDNAKRDLDPFEPLFSNEQAMLDVSTEERSLLGNVLVQTPAYINSTLSKTQNVWEPAVKASDAKALNPIREDPKKYSLSFPLNDAKFLGPTLILCGRQDEVVGYRDSLRLLELYPRSSYAILDRGTHGLPIDDHGIFEAFVNDWIARVQEWRKGNL